MRGCANRLHRLSPEIKVAREQDIERVLTLVGTADKFLVLGYAVDDKVILGLLYHGRAAIQARPVGLHNPVLACGSEIGRPAVGGIVVPADIFLIVTSAGRQVTVGLQKRRRAWQHIHVMFHDMGGLPLPAADPGVVLAVKIAIVGHLHAYPFQSRRIACPLSIPVKSVCLPVLLHYGISVALIQDRPRVREGVVADDFTIRGGGIQRVAHTFAGSGGVVGGNLQLGEGKAPSLSIVGYETVLTHQPDMLAVIAHLHTGRGGLGARPRVFHIPIAILGPSIFAIGTDPHFEKRGVIEKGIVVAEAYGEIYILSRLYGFAETDLQIGFVVVSPPVGVPEGVHITINKIPQLFGLALIGIRSVARKLVRTGDKVFGPQSLCPQQHYRDEHDASCDMQCHVVLHFLIR